ncbi:16S rRNA (cytosine(967)-C(5))-methyltransferase RsmB [candidate division KSB1 bacterium]|nr:16S rRNA (cytosine(967)-C(5))-methyltransferase RsmB [candidate division KSB1 bacterium]
MNFYADTVYRRMRVFNKNMQNKSKQFTNSRKAALMILQRIELDGAFSDIVINAFLQQEQFSDRDKAFINDLVRGTVRLKKRLDWIAGHFLNKPQKRLSDKTRFILRLAFYQVTEMQSVPAYAVVHQSVEMAKHYENRAAASMINAVLRSYLRTPQKVTFPDIKYDPVRAIALETSHPEWMVEKWINAFGRKQAQALCRANNRRPDVCFRRNPVKISGEHFKHMLQQRGIDFEALFLPDFFKLSSDFHHLQAPLKDGLLSIQDASAGMVAHVLAPQRKGRIVDLCAAPGGKSTHMAELVQDQTTIIANDLQRNRISLIRDAAQRLGLHSIQLLLSDGRYPVVQQADAILLDAPCSGHGVLAKRADLRWRRQKHDIAELQTIQQNLIDTAADMLNSGGTLVYSTCTIEREENEQIVSEFLQKHADFHVVAPEQPFLRAFTNREGYIKTLQHKEDMDGSFCVKMTKS